MKKLILILALLLPAIASAHSFKSGDIAIGHPWAKPTAAGADTAEVYMGFMNMGDKPDQLVSASASIAHGAVLNDGKGNVDMLPLAPMAGVPMRPGGAHVTLTGLKGALTEGDKFTVHLTFVTAPAIDVMVFVQSSPTESSMPHMDMGH